MPSDNHNPYITNREQKNTIDSMRRAQHSNILLDADRFLFISGPSGSGKTAFVDEILNATGFEYKKYCGTIDMTSKWRGEDTKNIVDCIKEWNILY